MSHFIEITTKVGCPCMCKYCPQEVFLKNYNSSQKELTLENCKKYFSTIPLSWGADVAGYSEPLLAKEIVEILEYLAPRGIALFTTLYQVKRDVIRRVFSIPNLFVRFHLPDIEGLTKIKLDKDLIRNYELAIRLLKLNGGRYQTCCWGTLPNELEHLIAGSECHESDINSLSDMAGNLKVDWLNPTYHSGYPVKCYRSDVYHLLPNGDISICCQDWSLDNVFGNLETQSFEEVLKSKKLNEIYTNRSNDDSDCICRRCSGAKRY